MLEALEVSGFATMQDQGRRGWRQYGIPLSGPMDWFAHRAANFLLENAPDAAVLEIGLSDALFRARRDCVLAVTGAGFEVENYVWRFPLWTSFYVRAGWNVQIKKTAGGNWAYLAAAGGFEAHKVLGSKSSYPRGGLGSVLQPGDMLQIGRPAFELGKLAARDFPVKDHLSYSPSSCIEVIAGPQAEQFTQESLLSFFASRYTVSSTFDRMGYRLEGQPIRCSTQTEMISEAMTTGSIQITPSGQPIVMMAESPTTGGYPKIAQVVRADLPVLAQSEPLKGSLHFREISVDKAQTRLRDLERSFSWSRR